MFATTKFGAAACAALGCSVLVSSCAPQDTEETAQGITQESAQQSTQETAQGVGPQAPGLRRPRARHYTLTRVGQYQGQSTPASGGARWYMPSTIEDQNGDGVRDLLLGQPYGHGTNPNRQGAVRILSGSDLSELRVIGPDDVDAEYDGTFGYSAHSLGDINYDGLTDFAIGSPVIRHRAPDGTLDPAGYNNTGLTYVLKSRSGGGFDVNRILGDDPSGYFGYWMATVSLNLPRVLRHGPPGARPELPLPVLGLVSSQARFRAGRAWGIEPRSGTVAYRASDDPANNDTISERRGYFVAPASDLNGNGITDFLVTANGQWITGDPDPRRYAGRVYFHDGLTGQLIRAVEGANETQQLGNRTAATQIDDVDRDGVEDFIVGSGVDSTVAGFPAAGVAYVISGRAIREGTDRVLRINEHPEIVLRTYTGSRANEYFGDNMTNLFDMDGDGVDEYAISAFGTVSAALPYGGAVYVYSGRTGEVLQTLEGDVANQYFGQQTIADRDNGTLYVVDVYYVDDTRHVVGRVSLFRAEPTASDSGS